MKSPLSPKAIACLKMAEVLHLKVESAHEWWRQLYELACAEFSEKAINAKFLELTIRGYLDYGVSARTAWLTPKGRTALDQALGIVRNPAVCQEALVKPKRSC